MYHVLPGNPSLNTLHKNFHVDSRVPYTNGCESSLHAISCSWSVEGSGIYIWSNGFMVATLASSLLANRKSVRVVSS